MLQEMKSDNSRLADCNDLERMTGSWCVPSSVSAQTSFIIEKYLSWSMGANLSLKADHPKERPLHHAGHEAGARTLPWASPASRSPLPGPGWSPHPPASHPAGQGLHWSLITDRNTNYKPKVLFRN